MDRSRHALFVLTALTGLGCSGSGSLSAEEATDLVMRDVIGELGDSPLVMFRYPQMIGPDDTLASYAPSEFDEEVPEITITDHSWLFWIDDEPGARFAHDSRLVLVDKDRELTIEDLSWWLLLNEEGLWLDDDYWGEDQVLTHEVSPPTGGATTWSGTVPPMIAPPSPGRDTAIVINAWEPGETGWRDFAQDGLDQTLLFESMGFETTYFGQAGTPGDDYLPGDPEVDEAVSEAAVIAQLEEAAGQLEAGDRLILYLTGHGFTLDFNDTGYIGDFDTKSLGAALDKFDDDVFIAVIADACESGGYHVLSLHADVVITSTDAYTSSYSDLDFESDINPGDRGGEFSSSFNAAMWEILTDPEEVEVLKDMADFLGVDWMTVLLDAAFTDSKAFDVVAQRGLTLPGITSELDDLELEDVPDDPDPDDPDPDSDEIDTEALDEISEAINDDPLLLAAAIIVEVFDLPIKHSASNVPESLDDTPATGIRAYGIDGGALIRETIDQIFETTSSSDPTSLLLPCGVGDVGYTICPDSDLAMPAGDYVLAYQLLEGPLPLESDEDYYIHSFVFDGDCQAGNDYEPSPAYPNDFFQETDTWYMVNVGGTDAPTLSRTVVQDDNSLTSTTTQARVVIRDDTMVAVIPADEFSCAEPSFRVTAFRHTGDWGMGADHDWSGDTEPPVDQGLAVWPD